MKSACALEQIAAPVRIRTTEGKMLEGDLNIPAGAPGVVLFAHGSGSSRHSQRNQHVARIIRDAGIGTLLFDLLTAAEESEDNITAHLRFDIGLLARRLADATRWVKGNEETRSCKVGYFGSSTGGGAALVAAAELGIDVDAIVSRGGRPDLAGSALTQVRAPTLLLVGELDEMVIQLNRQALARMRCPKEMKIVPGASHMFVEDGTLESVAFLAAHWFRQHLNKDAA